MLLSAVVLPLAVLASALYISTLLYPSLKRSLIPAALLLNTVPPNEQDKMMLSATTASTCTADAAGGGGGGAIATLKQQGQQLPLRVLLVIAHPDDECMFFAPTLLGLVQAQRKPEDVVIAVLCLSNGNSDGLGTVREKELVKSCEVLGIAASRVSVLNHSSLQDGMDILWREEVVVQVLASHLEKSPADVIITFDDKGISGHFNHRSVYFGVRRFLKLRPNAPTAYALETVNLIRKFIGPLDLIPTMAKLVPYLVRISTAHMTGISARERALFMASPTQVMNARRAMYCHGSQLVWYRHLYLIFSRYMVINELIKIK